MGEVIVVTGGTAGIGRATALRFAREGASVGVVARDRERLDETVRELDAAGGRGLAVQGDVADPSTHEEAAARVENAFGPIDVWVCNAMATLYAPVKDTTPAEYQRVTEVTYLGFVWGAMAALRRMLPRNRGTIVLVGSALAYRGIPLQAAYCGAKHAVQGFLDSLRTELLHDGTRVHLTMVQLPAHNTPQFEWGRTKLPRKPQPVPPIFQPEVAADAVYLAAHERRREIYVGAPTVQAIVVDKLAPGIADRYLARSGYEAQQTDEPVEPGRDDNLFEPVPGRFGAHGPFDERAKPRSVQLELTKRREWLALATALGLTGLAAALLR